MNTHGTDSKKNLIDKMFEDRNIAFQNDLFFKRQKWSEGKI